MLRDILVHADNTPQSSERLNYAAGLAALHQAHLTALHIRHPPFIPADVMGTGVAETVLQMQRAAQQGRAEETKKLVDATAQRNGVAIEWRDADGDIDDTLILHGYYSDLIIVGQSALGLDLEQPFCPDSSKAVVTSGRPVIVYPRDRRFTTFGQRILIAWKASAPAARAVADALPLLQKAQEVTILEVTENSVRQRIAGADISVHLSRHGIKVTAEPFVAPETEAFALIQARAVDLGVDLIVMGGYGYPRFWEAVLGGVTRQMLQEQPVPVLFSH